MGPNAGTNDVGPNAGTNDVGPNAGTNDVGPNAGTNMIFVWLRTTTRKFWILKFESEPLQSH